MMEQQGNTIILDDDVDQVVILNQANNENKIIRRNSSSASVDSGRGGDYSTTVSHITSNTSMRRDRFIAASHYGSQRSLWCELPEVKNAGLLEKLDDKAKKLQEAFFEVITSEASYLRSLNILITHFMAAPELLGSKGISSVISNVERKHLFSNIFSVRDCSERLLCDLETRLESNLLLTDVCDILCDHFMGNFEPYVKYCSNQVYQDRTLKKLKFENSSFMSCIQRLESDRLCQGLDMRSFLMLPMQRITRYPLLVIAILERTPQDSQQNKNAHSALHLANKVVTDCNEGARRMERTEQLLDIERRLIYKSPDLKRIALVKSGRYLVKRGMLTQLLEKRAKNLLHSSKQNSRNIYIFLFSDIIMITKKKMLVYSSKILHLRKFFLFIPIFIYLYLTEYFFTKGRQIELLLNADSESDRERWLSALRPPCSNPEEKIYADWDCPQAITVHDYKAGQEDELCLTKGDLVNILRKMPDGWFYGERVNDGAGGWFPSSYVQQVLNDHVRAKHYRQRLRVIQQQSSSSVQRRHPHFIKRFRRLSNPKSIFLSNIT
ncbi:unnamed protein product [Dracunculus medinensis]|uniref:Scaffold protein Tuba n=1 Tax=Dracunculus medinensis TaxID=318479 RepID=A0A0N4U2V9_DRAME|nr:unnamed protein product [Dracunculus medinensis]